MSINKIIKDKSLLVIISGFTSLGVLLAGLQVIKHNIQEFIGLDDITKDIKDTMEKKICTDFAYNKQTLQLMDDQQNLIEKIMQKNGMNEDVIYVNKSFLERKGELVENIKEIKKEYKCDF
jgi:hypothetical protein